MAELFPSFAKGLTPFWTLNWGQYSDFLTFKGGLNPVTGSLWLTDTSLTGWLLSSLVICTGQTGVWP